MDSITQRRLGSEAYVSSDPLVNLVMDLSLLFGEEARRTGGLAGAKVLRIGRKLLVSRAALDQALWDEDSGHAN